MAGVLHWGPLVAISIILVVTATSTYSALQLWSLPSSVVVYFRGPHFFIMYIWLVPVFWNFYTAMYTHSHVPLNWRPVSNYKPCICVWSIVHYWPLIPVHVCVESDTTLFDPCACVWGESYTIDLLTPAHVCAFNPCACVCVGDTLLTFWPLHRNVRLTRSVYSGVVCVLVTRHRGHITVSSAKGPYTVTYRNISRRYATFGYFSHSTIITNTGNFRWYKFSYELPFKYFVFVQLRMT